MGMFDYVHFEMDCPTCGHRLTTFQSKDADCTMDRIEPDSLSNFYESCHKCKTWVEFSRPRPPGHDARKTPLTFEQVTSMGFVMAVEEKESSNQELTGAKRPG